jgi:hypothetical protein
VTARALYTFALEIAGVISYWDSCSPSHNGGKNIVLRTLERLLRKAKPGLRLNEHIDESGDINRRLAVLARRSNRALR